MGEYIAAITRQVKRYGFDIPMLDSRKPRYQGERGDLERDMQRLVVEFESTSIYEKRREFAKELAMALGRYLALD